MQRGIIVVTGMYLDIALLESAKFDRGKHLLRLRQFVQIEILLGQAAEPKYLGVVMHSFLGSWES